MNKIKSSLNHSYKKGLSYELGSNQIKNYQIAFSYYQIGSLEGDSLSKRKLKYTRIQLFLWITIAISLMVIVFGLITNNLWISFFITGILLFTGTIIDYRHIWYKKHYVYFTYSFLYYVALIVLLPISALIPYLRGISFIPLIILFIISFMISAFGIIFLISEKDNFSVKVLLSGLFILASTIISFYIETPDKLYEVREIEGGLVITQYRSSNPEVIIPKLDELPAVATATPVPAPPAPTVTV
jgi:hypothetical protein